jgi:hypothetical protein
MTLILLYALTPLLLCIAALAIAFRHWRKYPILHDAMKLKRPHWLALFISCGIGAISFGGAFGLDHLLDSSFDGLIMFFLLPLGLVAIVCSFISAVWCLSRLIAALLSHVHSLQSKQN